jgi:hypothetical protein
MCDDYDDYDDYDDGWSYLCRDCGDDATECCLQCGAPLCKKHYNQNHGSCSDCVLVIVMHIDTRLRCD